MVAFFLCTGIVRYILGCVLRLVVHVNVLSHPCTKYYLLRLEAYDA